MAIRRDQADVWFSKAVRMRDGNICQNCGKGPNTECAHIFGRARKSVRWDMMNAVALCHWCHKYFTANPVTFYDSLLEWYGEGFMDILREKQNAILKTNKELRAEVSKHYRDEVRKKEIDPSYRIQSWC